MKKFAKIFISVFLLLTILITITSIYSIFTIKKHPAPLYYIQSLPGKLLATTIPPFGIFIKEKYIDEGDKPGTILAHEKIHWLQYQERGLFNFYYEYLKGLLKHGRLYNNLEKDARIRSSK